MTARKSTKLSVTAQAARESVSRDDLHRAMGEEMSKPSTTAAERDALGSMFAWLSDKSISVEFSIARTLSALIAGLTAGSTLAFFGLQAIEVLAVAAFAFSGSTFLAFTIGFVGMALTLIGAVVLTGKVQEYILSGGIDRTYEASKALATEKIAVVRSWFKTRGEKAVDTASNSAAATCSARSVRHA